VFVFLLVYFLWLGICKLVAVQTEEIIKGVALLILVSSAGDLKKHVFAIIARKV